MNITTKTQTPVAAITSLAIGFSLLAGTAYLLFANPFLRQKTNPPDTITTNTNAPLATTGAWISPAELVALPRTGAAFSAVNAVANGSLGPANISNINSPHPERTMGTALVAVATNNAALREKAVNAIISAIGTEAYYDGDTTKPGYDPNPVDPWCVNLGARGLAVGRNLIGYVIAADVMNLRTGGYDPNGKGTQVQNWIQTMLTRRNCHSTGPNAITEGGLDNPTLCGSNGCSMGLASRIAADVYLGQTADLETAWNIFRRMVGESQPASIVITLTTQNSSSWQTSPAFAVNRLGAVTSSGYPADGVIVNDQARGDVAPKPPACVAPWTAPVCQPVYTAYPWEGLQGLYASALMLDRAGKKQAGLGPWEIQDKAMLRAVKYQAYLQATFGHLPPANPGDIWYDSSRAAWVKSLVSSVYGYKPYAFNASGGARNVDFTQWTHAKYSPLPPKLPGGGDSCLDINHNGLIDENECPLETQ